MPYSVSSWFVDQCLSTAPTIRRKFLIGSSDYSERVTKWPTINRKWNDLKSTTITIGLYNQDQALNFIRDNKTNLQNSASIYLGVLNVSDTSRVESSVGAWLYDSVSTNISSGTNASTDISLISPANLSAAGSLSRFALQNNINYYVDGFSTTNYLERAYLVDLDAPVKLTVSAWVKPYTSVTSTVGIAGNNESNFVSDRGGYTLQTRFDNRHSFGITNNAGTAASAACSGTASVNTWAHLVGTVSSGGNVRIYKNGVLEGVTATAFGIGNTITPFRVGVITQASTPTLPWSGGIFGVKTYTTALTDAEVLNLYLYEKGLVLGEPELINLFSGTLKRAEYSGGVCNLTIVDKFKQLEERTVGTSDVPVSYTASSYLPSDLVWYLVTSYGGFSTVKSSSNPDIDYAAYQTWSSIFSGDSVLMNAEFDGGKVLECVRKIARHTFSGVFVKENKLSFVRFGAVNANVSSIGPNHLYDLSLSFDDEDIKNKQFVYAGYSVASDYWTISTNAANSSSVNSFGRREGVEKDENVWYTTSGSALNLAQRMITVTGLPYDQVNCKTGLATLPQLIGETIYVEDAFHSIQDSYRIMEQKIDMDKCELSARIDRSQLTSFFVLDTSSLDGSDTLS